MAPGQGRRRRGDRRIDAAIDHFKDKGYEVRIIRSAVAALLKVYGIGPASWPFLEEDSYHAVQEKLFEMEGEEKQKQLLLEDHQADQMEEQHQQQEADVAILPENNLQVSIVHDMAPTVIPSQLSAIEQRASPNISPCLEPLLSLPPATQEAPVRPPTYGWISDESDSESELEDGEIQPDKPRFMDVC
ncbi:hypothetical protein EJB05_44342 [Eragrostis curvula]|uniref:WIYLD domain-containing protein n=1 Tax=Eragrostis curvula TaxID=38414 RepID=A0A5J9THE8_9POAL|nr:hypothetical protein EJB05_44342 [Eragrostis curvula]